MQLEVCADYSSLCTENDVPLLAIGIKLKVPLVEIVAVILECHKKREAESKSVSSANAAAATDVVHRPVVSGSEASGAQHEAQPIWQPLEAKEVITWESRQPLEEKEVITWESPISKLQTTHADYVKRVTWIPLQGDGLMDGMVFNYMGNEASLTTIQPEPLLTPALKRIHSFDPHRGLRGVHASKDSEGNPEGFCLNEMLT